MTETAQAAETSNNASQPELQKGDQLEGKKSETLTTKQAAAMFKGSMISDTPDDGGKSEGEKGKSPKDQSKKAKKSEKDKSTPEEDDTNSDDEETDLNEEGQSEDDEADDVEEDGAEDEDDADADEADAEDEDEANDEDLYTVIVDGEEVEVTHEELINGYQRQADYTKKSMELAEQRKALEAEKEQVADLPRVKEAYQTEAKRFGQNAELVLVAFENGFMPQPPSEELRQSDPAQYLLAKEKHQEALQFMHGLKGEMQKANDQAEADHANAVREGRQKLLQMQPQLQDADTRGKFQKYILEAGFTEDQIKREADPRLFEFAYKAMKYDELVERSKQKPEPKKKRPKVMKNKKAREDASSIAQKRKSETQSRHAATKSVKSASDVLAERIRSSQNKRKR